MNIGRMQQGGDRPARLVKRIHKDPELLDDLLERLSPELHREVLTWLAVKLPDFESMAQRALRDARKCRALQEALERDRAAGRCDTFKARFDEIMMADADAG